MVKCPVCQREGDEDSYLETYTSPFNNQEYKLYHCKGCDLMWWEPLKIIPEFYEMGGNEAYEVFHIGIREEIENNHRLFFEHIPIKSGRLLDVGCGDGVFLKEAEKAGYEVWGIDFDSKSIKVCQEKRGLKNTYAMTPEEFLKFCQSKDIKFDVITFFEVLEHQDKPREFLETIKQMLKPGGYIAGSVPNRNNWIVNIHGRKIGSGDLPPHHFLRFSEQALHNTLAQNFRDIFIKPTPVELPEIVPALQVYITGQKINKILRKKITTNELAGEGTTIYRNLPFWRKAIFKSLRGIRLLVFLPVALPLKFLTTGERFYFQARS